MEVRTSHLAEDVANLIQRMKSVSEENKKFDALMGVAEETEAFFINKEKKFKKHPLAQQKLIEAYQKSIRITSHRLGKISRENFLALEDIANTNEVTPPPSHLAILQFAQTLSQTYVTQNIISQATLEQRQLRAGFWLAVMLDRFNKRDYQTVVAIRTALNHVHVERALNKGWPKAWEKIKNEIDFFMAPSRQKALIEKRKHAIIPDLGSLKAQFIHLKEKGANETYISEQVKQIAAMQAKLHLQLKQQQHKHKEKSVFPSKENEEGIFQPLTQCAISNKSKVHVNKKVRAYFEIMEEKEKIVQLNLKMWVLANDLKKLASRATFNMKADFERITQDLSPLLAYLESAAAKGMVKEPGGWIIYLSMAIKDVRKKIRKIKTNTQLLHTLINGKLKQQLKNYNELETILKTLRRCLENQKKIQWAIHQKNMTLATSNKEPLSRVSTSSGNFSTVTVFTALQITSSGSDLQEKTESELNLPISEKRYYAEVVGNEEDNEEYRPSKRVKV